MKTELACRIWPENCFSADLSVVRTKRVASVLPNPEKYVPGAPDFAIEVISPRNTIREIEHYTTFDLEGILSAAPVLMGLAFPVREVFEDPAY